MAVNLEHFPTNETALRIMDRVSPIYAKSYVGKWLFEVMGLEMGEAREYFEELRQQPFPERTTWAISYWERRYAIVPKPTDTLEVRRRNIIMKRSVRLPMNPARMEVIVNALTGGQTTVTENVDDYTFRVTINGVAPGMNTIGVLKEIKKHKPSHQTFDYTVILESKQPAFLRVGGQMSSIVRFPLPELPDCFHIESTLHIGGQMTSVIQQPIPAIADRFHFQDTIHVGGCLTSSASLPIPEHSDNTSMTHTARLHKRTTTSTTISIPEFPD